MSTTKPPRRSRRGRTCGLVVSVFVLLFIRSNAQMLFGQMDPINIILICVFIPVVLIWLGALYDHERE